MRNSFRFMKTSSDLVPGIGGAVCSPHRHLQVAPNVFLLLLALSPLALAQQVDRWKGPAEAEPVVPWRAEAPAARTRLPLFAAPWMTYNAGVTSSAGEPDRAGDGRRGWRW